MEIINATGFPVEGQQAIDPSGKRFLLAIAKATYCFPSDAIAAPCLAPAQWAIHASDVMEAEPEADAPVFEADSAYFKPYCDVVVKAAAHAPERRPVDELDVAFRVAGCEKWAHVVGNRHWRRGILGLSPSAPEPFLRMPITYARSYGGSCAGERLCDAYLRNPVGCGYASPRLRSSLVGQPVPNIEQRGNPVGDPGDSYTPVSFGPVGRSWAGRIEYAGRYDQRWLDEVFPLLPGDFDERYFQCVGPDQQIAYPTGGERVDFYRLHPDRPLISFTLPRLDLPMAVIDRERRLHVLRPVVDTLCFDVEKERFSVTWRARLPIRRALDEIHTLAAGSLCKRWWKARVLGTGDCGCGGFETNDEDLAPVNQAFDV